MKATIKPFPTTTKSVEKLLHESFIALFKVSGVDEIKMPLDAVLKLIDCENKRFWVAEVLQRMGYCSYYPATRGTYPRIEQDGTVVKVSFHSKCYHFHKNDLNNK